MFYHVVQMHWLYSPLYILLATVFSSDLSVSYISSIYLIYGNIFNIIKVFHEKLSK